MLHTPILQSIDKSTYMDAHILIVDDDKTNCLLLEAILHGAGFHSITLAQNDTEAFAAINTQAPDIILLDIVMPGINGLELCQKLKKTPNTNQTPVIFLSGLEGVKVKTKAFNSGGVDYITKPYHKQEVIARVMAHVRNGLIMRKLSQYNTAIKQELQMAEHFQRSLLPTSQSIDAYEEVYDLHIAAAFMPCTELAGDYWAFLPIDDKSFGIFMCDFSGHGVAAALETVRFHSLVHEFKDLWADPIALFKAINERLTPQLSAASFATAQYAVFNTEHKTIDLLGAGTPALLQLHGKGQGYSFHSCAGFPIGIDAHNTDFTQTKLTYTVGDMFVFYSDALSETAYKAKGVKILKAQNIKKLLDTNPFEADATVDHLLKLYLKAPEEARTDDLTLVAIQPN